MKKTTFAITKMDCAAEEQLIRLKLEGFNNIASLKFNISERKLGVYYIGELEPISRALESLGLGAKIIETTAAEADHETLAETQSAERKLLRQVLAINFFFFLIEIITGLISNSIGLIADSLDMLADALVYGLALYAVAGTIAAKKKIAQASGYFQLFLAVFGLFEVVRRFAGYEESPAFQMMIGISLFALIANWISLYLLQKSKSEEAHMQASMIFTSNDMLANIGVITAGFLVYLTNSKLPDLMIGLIIFLIVGRGALRILQLSKS